MKCPILRTLMIWLVLSVTAPAIAVERSLWFFDTLTLSPEPTPKEETRNQASASATNYLDSASLQAKFTGDLSLFEVTGQASQRLFLAQTDKGKETQSLLEPLKQAVGIELARYYATKSSHFGRIGVGYLYFHPGVRNWLKIGLSSGMLPTGEMPWMLNLHFSYLYSLNQEGTVLNAMVEVLRTSESAYTGLRWGGMVSWTNRGRTLTIPGVYEAMGFSLGPEVRANFGLGDLRAALLWRLWLDREIQADLTNPNGGTLSFTRADFVGIPDLLINYAIVF